MKVVQMVPRMEVGGVEKGVVDLVKYFRDGRIEHQVISGGGQLVPRLQEYGARHRYSAVYRKSPFSLALIPKVRRILVQERAAILHARSRVPAWIGFFATRNTDTHFLTTAHGMYKSRRWSEVMSWGKYVICPSRTVARHIKQWYQIPDEKIIVIPRWVDLSLFSCRPYSERRSSNLIVSVGRISPSKGYEYLIEAFKRLVRENSYLTLHIVGTPDASKMNYFHHLKHLVTRHSLHYNVKFIGYREDIPGILHDARMLVAPSVQDESFGRVIIEAMAAGVPVVASRVGGYQELIRDGRDGILVNPRDSESLAGGMREVLQESMHAAYMTEQARGKVEREYTLETCLEKTAGVYEKTVSEKRILVMKISALGDLILVFPALRALRERFPRARITLLTHRKFTPLLFECPYVDEVVSVEDRYRRLGYIVKLSGMLRRKSYDYVIDLQNNRASHLIAFLTFPRYSFGYRRRLGFLLSRPAEITRSDDPMTSQERILRYLGVTLKSKELLFWETGEKPSLHLPQGNFIGVNVGASRKWETKNWPVDSIVKLIRLIYKYLPSYKVALLGDRDSCARARQIDAAVFPQPFDLCGKTQLGDLPSLLRQLDACVTPDTATLHLARACGVPVVALFGPTDPRRHTVASSELRVLEGQTECRHCYRPRCGAEDPGQCMHSIEPKAVFQELKSLLSAAGK
ncbi:MAG: glycosyltransferase [Candidatus Omnitrophica bacterium]|nr:glycosyltransferase [Candidatus Omnitrophota bacterium]